MSNEPQDFAKEIFHKCANLQYVLFTCIVLYFSSLADIYQFNNKDLSNYRQHSEEITTSYNTLKELSKNYFYLANLTRKDLERVAQLSSYYNFIALETKSKDLKEVISFLQYLSNISSKVTTNYADSNITISELLIFSEQLNKYSKYINDISLIGKTISTNTPKGLISQTQYDAIKGGENPIVAIVGKLGIELQKVNPLNNEFENLLCKNAKALFYNDEEFKTISLSQMLSLQSSYSENIQAELNNKLSKRHKIPIIDISIDKSIFGITILIVLIIICFILNVETSCLYKYKNNLDILDYNNVALIPYMFLAKSKVTPLLNKIILNSWTFINLLPPILLAFSFIIKISIGSFDYAEIFLIILFILLYSYWILHIFNFFKKQS